MNTDGSGQLDFCPIDYTVNAMCGILSTFDDKHYANKDCYHDIYQIGVLVHHPTHKLVDLFDYVHYHPDWEPGKKHPRIKYISNKYYFDLIQFLKYDIPLNVLWPLVIANRLIFGDLGDVDVGRLSEINKVKHELKKINPNGLTKIARKIEVAATQRKKLAKFHENYVYFYNLKIIFDNNNVEQLYKCLDEDSKRDFYFDTREVDRFKFGFDTALKAADDMEEFMKESKQRKSNRRKELLQELKRLKKKIKKNRNNQAITSKL